MKIKLMLLFLLSVCYMLSAQQQNCVVLDVRGEIKVRPINDNQWLNAAEGRILDNRETIRSGATASARISTFDGRIFLLQENAQIEPRELKQRDRDEIVMELTALEMLKLPGKKKAPSLNQSAFVLHGELPDSTASISQKDDERFIRLESEGAWTLYEQGFVAGFILKWNRLVNIFPEVRSEKAEAALIRAYRDMEMPYRMEKAATAFKKRWPDSQMLAAE